MVPSMKTQYINQCVKLWLGLIWNLHAVMIFVTSFTMTPCWDFLIFFSYREKPVVMKLHCGYELQYNMNYSNWAADYKGTQEKSCF